MNSQVRSAALVFVFGWFFATGLLAQTPKVDFPSASPTATLKQHIGLTDIAIEYSRPSVKGRVIYGGVVPYNEVWRTGANASTKISFSTAVKLNGTEIPAGKYALFTIPGETEWTVIISKDTNSFGAFSYKPENDLARFKATPVKLAEPVESFTIDFNDLRDESATLNLVWEKTRVPIKFEAPVVSKVVAQIDAVMAAPDKKEPPLYFQAAMFYLNHDLDLKKALAWLETGLADRPKIAYELLNVKARILAKQGDKEGAIAAAKQSSELAVQADGPTSPFVKMNQVLISSLH